MNRRWILGALAVLPAVAAAQLDSLKSLMSDPLVGGLKAALGVTDAPAEGGLGSILTLAQEKLAKGDFDKIVGVVPGSQKYLDAAKKLGAVTGRSRMGQGSSRLTHGWALRRKPPRSSRQRCSTRSARSAGMEPAPCSQPHCSSSVLESAYPGVIQLYAPIRYLLGRWLHDLTG